MVSHDFQHRGSAEAGNVKFSIEQRMGSAVVLLQEVRNWPGEARRVVWLRTLHRH